MRKIDNYMLVNFDESKPFGEMVLAEDVTPEKGYCIRGVDFRDNSPITEPISKIALLSKKTTTMEGEEYRNISAHRHWSHFMRAAFSEDTWVLKDWRVIDGELFGYLFKRGYCYNDWDNMPAVWGKVISQDLENNICVISAPNGQQYKVYVDWLDVHFETYDLLCEYQGGRLLKEAYEFAGEKIKFDLLGKHKEVLNLS